MKSYTKGSNQTAVVLYTIPLVNAVYLTLKPALVNPDKASTSELLSIGRIMDNCTILTASSIGIFLQLTKKIKGFVPLRHVSDKEIVIEDIKNHFPVKSQKRCRILQHAALDDVYICTLKKYVFITYLFYLISLFQISIQDFVGSKSFAVRRFHRRRNC